MAQACALLCVLCGEMNSAAAQALDEELRQVPAAELAAQARASGDAARGAVVFFQHYMACSKCHAVGDPKPATLGPDLAALGKEVRDDLLVESVLLPSQVIRKGFESVTVVTTRGKTLVGLLVERTAEKVVLRDIGRDGEKITLPASEIEDFRENTVSIMPAGQMNLLTSRQQFLDLVRYLMEIRDGGSARARELQPAPALITFTLPEYEKHLDHGGLIGGWNGEALQRGEAIYRRVCANCHGTRERVGSLPTSLRFAEGKFKNGSDPLSMYNTLTRGFGLMAAQTWMVPSQKYDVIHYIRETYLRPHNAGQFVAVDQAYLSRLPKGDTRGPEPSKIEPWSAMDYGPTLAHTYEIPGDAHNFAYKGIAMRLDPGAGGVSRGRHWMIFDIDTFRVAAAWSAAGSRDASQNFIDWRGIQFNGEHQIHPRIVGQVALANSTGPGWADPATASFVDDQRVEGRDGRRYGPLPRAWARFRGLYHHGQDAVLSYAVGTTSVLEWPRILANEPTAAPSSAVKPGTVSESAAALKFLRTFNIGPRDRDLVLQVAEAESAVIKSIGPDGKASPVVMFAPPDASDNSGRPAAERKVVFDGGTFLEIADGSRFDMTSKDFTIAARLKTSAGGTVFAVARPGPKWTPDGQALFVRDGRLCFDIGWVGVVSSRTKVNDGKWHNVTATWQKSSRQLRLYIDGKLDAEGKLSAKASLADGVARIGFTAPDFPGPLSYFQGELAEVRFYQRRLSEGLKEFSESEKKDDTLLGRWRLAGVAGTQVADATKNGNDATVHHDGGAKSAGPFPVIAGFSPRTTPVVWHVAEGRLQLKIPAGPEPLRFTVWTATMNTADGFDPVISDADFDLAAFTHGGPARWSQPLETRITSGSAEGPFVTDVLTAPESNPWLAQVRFTGLDFLPDGRIAVCSWDGDVWLVDMAPTPPSENEPAAGPALRWRRIASGLFQPLGLKFVAGKIHVTCRDQLAVLHDLNGDDEIDFYECLNSDHQVTEHFHEFAMGLQTDAEGNFYYAKSGRHALPAVVPQHGTLLRVAPDGARTDILAVGFRAANGVCLNPDGSFVVTDQEGFWNPKNRINWVTLDPSGKPRFYGNMLGYHDVTDSSDAAMEPPLCWITNAFDRSPAELLWVDSDRWGPLNGSLLNLSYGYGKVFVVPHEKVNGKMQGGMIELPISPFPTGVMRGRFYPADGQLYLCGMFAWAGSATHPGGLYRLRATGQPMHLPVGLHATKAGLKIKFTEPIAPDSLDKAQIQIKTWSLKRTANYGSEHYNEQPVKYRGLKLSSDGTTLLIDIPDLRPTWCMEIKYSLRAADGKPIAGTVHNTIHELGD
jgi:putative heme-binding domain-containing protein